MSRTRRWNTDAVTPTTTRALLTASRIVLFSRAGDFADTVRDAHRHLHGAVALELAPVTADDAVAYLRRSLPDPLPAPWLRLLRLVRQQPRSALSRALNSPLTVTLVRDTFHDPAVQEALLDGRFTRADKVTGYLLDRFVTLTYEQRHSPGGKRLKPYAPQDARRWLAYLAGRMAAHRPYNGVDWRRMHWWLPPLPRVALVAVLGICVATTAGTVAFSDLGDVGALGRRGVGFGAVWTAVMGLAVGLAVAVIAELRGPAQDGGGGRGRRFHPAAALLTGILVALQSAAELKDVGLGPHTVLFILRYCVTAGLVSAIWAGFGAMPAHPPARPGAVPRVLTLYSYVPLGSALPAGLAIGTAFALNDENGSRLAGPAAGVFATLAVALLIGAARPSEHADGHPATSWRREQWRALYTAVPFGACLGTALGLANGVAKEGGRVQEGLVVGLCAAVSFGLAASVATSDVWRTTAVFLCLRPAGRFPAFGMRFLRDTYDRGVLRADGPRYQFRHALLQDALRPPPGTVGA